MTKFATTRVTLLLLTLLFLSSVKVTFGEELFIYSSETKERPPKTQFFRVEILFTHFENIDGRTYNGKRCDIATKCDPIIYSFIDM